ncbi:hypothetical protein ACLOJK_003310 [Asimina triloba]
MNLVVNHLLTIVNNKIEGSDRVGALVRIFEAFLWLSELNEQSVLLDPPLLRFLSGNVTDNDFIELTNGAWRAKTELSCEIMISYALDEGCWEGSAFEPFRSGKKVHVDVIVDHMSIQVLSELEEGHLWYLKFIENGLHLEVEG